MADYALKVKSTLEHPSASIIEDCWQSHYGNYPNDREPFGVKVKKTLTESEIDSVPLVPPIPAPWIKSSSASSWKYLLPYKNKIRDHITDLWQERWDYCDTGQFYRDLHPVVDYKIKVLIRPRHKDVQITRLRLRHVRLAEKLHTIGKRPDPLCTVCHEPEDVDLIKCPLQEQLHRDLRKYCSENNKCFNLKSILRSDHCSHIIIHEYIKSSGSIL